MATTTRIHLKTPTGEFRSFGPYEMDLAARRPCAHLLALRVE
jgi:hypothetical protein